MLIKTKLRVGSVLLALLPATLAGTLIGVYSTDHAEDALQVQAQSRLVALREEKASQIAAYFAAMSDQAAVYARDRMTVEAMRLFSSSFHSMASATPSERSALEEYYRGDFGGAYEKRNNGTRPPEGIFQRLGNKAAKLQFHYIKENPHPLGEKDKLLESSDGSGYSSAHAIYHESFRELQQRFGYYDIFLIDAESGDVVYTVFKELDFATSLKSGPWADSGLAKAYAGAMLLSEGSTFMTDFAPYLPSYQDPAAFISAPVFDRGRRVGVIAFQLPIDRINNVMTSFGKWREVGLGDSGETYLVGSDNLMRSQSRFFLEDPEGFFAALKAAGSDQTMLSTIRTKGTVIGFQKVRSPGVEQALSGATGFAEFPDYRGVPVLSAFRPLEINGHRWAILAEIDRAEAYAAADQLHRDVLAMVAATGAVLIILGGGIGWLFSRSLAGPLERIVLSMRDISSGSGDLTVRLDDKHRDELGQIAGAFNQFVTKLESIMRQVTGSTNELATASEELSMITRDTRDGMQQQQGDIQQVAAAINEMTASVREVAKNTHETAESAHHVGDQVAAGKGVLARSAQAVQELSDRMRESLAVVEALQDDSSRVGTVLEVIRGIADQTNLLALNAAIEAARAGEQGRGFAVVADEVRTLAMRTQQSTEEIREIIEALQARSAQTVGLLQENNANIETSVELSAQTQQAFLEIDSAMHLLLDMSSQIASASEEQAAVTEEISSNVDKISQVAESIATGSEQTEASSQMLARLGDDLMALVGQFKVGNG